MKLGLSRRELINAIGRGALLVPLSLLFAKTGCGIQDYDVEISLRAQRSGSVLEITQDQLGGVDSNWNQFIINGDRANAMYIFSIHDMWGDWIFEVNGNRIYENVSEYRVNSGDIIVWKGNFPK